MILVCRWSLVLPLERLAKPFVWWELDRWLHLLLEDIWGSKIKEKPQEPKALFLREGCNVSKSIIIRGKWKDAMHRLMCVHQRLLNGLYPCLCCGHPCGPRLVTPLALLRFFICKIEVIKCLFTGLLWELNQIKHIEQLASCNVHPHWMCLNGIFQIVVKYS